MFNLVCNHNRYNFLKIFKSVFFGALLFFGYLSAAFADTDEPQLILIHLDAASSLHVLQEMDKGNLPNLETFFGDHGRIDHTITYFPSKTPAVISSLRFGESIREIPLPGWVWVADKTEQSFVRTIGTFLRMVFSKSRISTTNVLYGIRGLHWLAGPALVNTADYLKDYNILEFYYYNVDTQGHFNGEEAYIEELIKFDHQIGRLMKRLDDDVNVIIYSDHGMTFGTGIEIESALEELMGDVLEDYSYPSVFINDVNQVGDYAERIVEETDIDFTFFRSSETQVKGFHENSKIYFNKNYEDVTINYEFEGQDALGYNSRGYQGEFLNQNEWLEFSNTFKYPMAPVNLFYYFDNPVSGDIVVLFDETKFPQTGYSSSGNHGGFTYRDMTVPLFLKGPILEEFHNKDYYWLPNLFQDIEGIDFDQYPQRERHYIASRYDFRRNRTVTDFTISPSYRIKYGVTAYNSDFDNLSTFDRVDFTAMGDLYRSYLSRLWIGVGAEVKNSELNPIFKLQYDLHIRKFVLHNSYATHRNFEFRLSFEATPWLALETVNFTSLGIRYDF